MSAKKSPGTALSIHHLSRAMNQAMGEKIKQYGVSPGQYPVLMCLWEEDGLNQRELYERIHIEQATMSNTLGRMERDGLVKRKTDRQDRRAMRVHLTAKAKKLEAKISTAAAELDKQALSGLKVKDKKAFMDFMKTMIENLES